MKKVLVAMAFFFAIGLTTVSAQDAPKPKKQQFGWNKQYMDEIGVSAEAQVKIESVKKESDAEMKALREDKELSEEVKKDKMKALNIKRQKAIYAFLTPEEIEKGKLIMARIRAANEAAQ